MKKLNEPIDDWENPGVKLSVDTLMRIFPAYHDHHLLPEAGGTGDQNPHIMDALNTVEYMVAWHVQNEGRADLDELPDFRSDVLGHSNGSE